VRGDSIKNFIWSGVIDEGGKICGAINVRLPDRAWPLQIQATEAELFALARMLRETARAVKAKGGASLGPGPADDGATVEKPDDDRVVTG
jgi:hypothetical protein